MNKYSFVPKSIYYDKKLNDGFVNFYRQGIFIRCFEYTAIIVSEITWYRVYPNVDKKTWFVYLELWYPKDKENIITRDLEDRWYNIRIIEKDWNITETIWSKKLEKWFEKLLELKKQLIKFT